eukprot:2613616-Pyramimonas_sp.AAC.1
MQMDIFFVHPGPRSHSWYARMSASISAARPDIGCNTCFLGNGCPRSGRVAPLSSTLGEGMLEEVEEHEWWRGKKPPHP